MSELETPSVCATAGPLVSTLSGAAAQPATIQTTIVARI